MRWLNGVLTFLLIVMVATTGGVIWFTSQVDKPGPNSDETLITIKSGKGARAIAEQLETNGLITSRHIFLAHQLTHNIWERSQGRTPAQLKAGEYLIKPSSSVRDIANVIRVGKAVLLSVSIPEGLTSHQIVQRLIANPKLTGDIATIPPEGFLMPDTYRVPRNADRTQILNMMAEAQRNFLREMWEQRQADLPFKDVSEALILASMIEKETGPKDDPARIAGVFVNRLRKGMRLQSDPTILYGKFGSKVAWGSTIYRSDIQKKTTHNTYQIDGLPPTPICNPGRASIKAALNPAQTRDLFFVANGEGGHIFSETVQQHNRAVAQWRKIEKKIIAAKKKAKKVQAASTAAATKTPVTRINAAAIPANPSNTAVKIKVITRPTETVPAIVPVTPNGVPLPQRKPAR